MTSIPFISLDVIRYEQEQQRRAMMTKCLLRGGWDAPTATPSRLRGWLAAAAPLRRGTRRAAVANEANETARGVRGGVLLPRRSTG